MKTPTTRQIVGESHATVARIKKYLREKKPVIVRLDSTVADTLDVTIYFDRTDIETHSSAGVDWLSRRSDLYEFVRFLEAHVTKTRPKRQHGATEEKLAPSTPRVSDQKPLISN